MPVLYDIARHALRLISSATCDFFRHAVVTFTPSAAIFTPPAAMPLQKYLRHTAYCYTLIRWH